jgi:hypothetical protein
MLREMSDLVKSCFSHFAFRLSALLALALIPAAANVAEPAAKFDRTYTPQGSAHLRVININGEINIYTWDRKSISVKAAADPRVSISDEVRGSDITVRVRQSLRPGRANFVVFAPTGASISLSNVMGNIGIQGVRGHIRVDSFDSDVRLTAIRAPSIEVKVVTGDIHFEGDLQRDGAYSFQSMKGDLDISLPGGTPFNLTARAFSEKINLGEFMNNFSGSSRGAKGMSGAYRGGGARLTLTTYSGRILFHKR